MRIVNARLRLDDEGVPRVVKSPAKLYPDLQLLQKPPEILKVMTEVFEIHREAQEVLYLIALNLKGKPLAFFEIGRGNIEQIVVDVRGIMIRLMMCNAPSFIMVHNHPSGDCIPSSADIQITERIKQLSDLMHVHFTDHLIIATEKEYFSFFSDVWNREKNEDNENHENDHVEA